MYIYIYIYIFLLHYCTITHCKSVLMSLSVSEEWKKDERVGMLMSSLYRQVM